MEKFDVIMPAGGRLDDHFARVALTPYKALIKVQDLMVGYRPFEAVLMSGRAERVVVVGPAEVQQVFQARATMCINDTGEMVKNISTAIRTLKEHGPLTRRILIVTCDLPYATEKGMIEFLDAAPAEKDIVASIVTKEAYVDRFPGSSSTWAKLGAEELTMAGAFIMDPNVFLRVQDRIEQVVQNRKSIPKMAKLLGGKFLWDYTMKKLTMADVILKIEEVIGAKIGVVRNKGVELAFDIDDIPDYEYALRNK